MTKEELIEKLKAIEGKHKTERFYDSENGHVEADDLLIEYINDKEIADAFEEVSKWYA